MTAFRLCVRNACLLAVSVVFVVTPRAAASQAASPPASTNPWIELEIASARLGENRKLRIALPAGYLTATRSYPVLVILDADDQPQFTAAISSVRFLAARRAIQPLIIVGVTNGKDRTGDLMPPVIGPMPRGTPPDFTTRGDAFFEYLTTEVLPLVRAQYRAASYTVFAGHSLGGLMGTYFAAMHPGAFNGIIAMSPSLWAYDSHLVAPYARAIAASTAPLRLFATSGGYEPPIDRNTIRFLSQLRALKPARVAVGSTRYAEDTHGLTPMTSLVDGLRFVFAPVSLAVSVFERLANSSPDSASWVRTFDDMETRYAAGLRLLPARELGLANELLPEVHFEESVLMASDVATHVPSGAWSAARVMANRYVSRYPNSARAHRTLADLLLSQRDTISARAWYTQSIELARAKGDSTFVRTTTEQLTRLASPMQ